MTLFSPTVEYALRAVIFLASRPGGAVPTEEVARHVRVPAPYLAKVLQTLGRAGLIRTQRGAGGGVALRVDPAVATLFDVVDAVEPIQRIRTCPLGLHGPKLCALHARLDAAFEEVERAFRATTLADVLADPSPSIPLCAR